MINPKSKNLDIYGSEPIPWSRALAQLDAGGGRGTYWLATMRPDGRPHICAFGGLWVDAKVYLVSGAASRKRRYLSANPNCAVSVSLPGLALAIEASVARVT